MLPKRAGHCFLYIIIITITGLGANAFGKESHNHKNSFFDMHMSEGVSVTDYSCRERYLQSLSEWITQDIISKASQCEQEKLRHMLELIAAAENSDSFFDSPVNFGRFLIALAETMLISASHLDYDDFESQLVIPSSLLITRDSLMMIHTTIRDPEWKTVFDKEIKIIETKSMELAKNTLKNFPEQGRAHGQMAFVLLMTGGDKKKALRMYESCIDIDPEAAFCHDGYQSLADNLCR